MKIYKYLQHLIYDVFNIDKTILSMCLRLTEMKKKFYLMSGKNFFFERSKNALNEKKMKNIKISYQ